MKNPPDFVMYVVMVKLPNRHNFHPNWETVTDCGEEHIGAVGFKSRSDADDACKYCRALYGKKNAYIQQYGPYS